MRVILKRRCEKFLISFIVVFFTFVNLSYGADRAGGAGPKLGTEAPDFIGRTVEGKLFKLSRNKEQPKVINFFWVYCEPCKKEMPELAVLEQKYANVKFISVHTEDNDGDKVEEFLSKLSGYPSNIVLSGKKIKDSYKYPGLPHTIVLDKDNKVLLNLVGYTHENIVRLEEVLKTL